ncbi:hypothetical protein MXM33_07315 [Acinetobacter vivianii]|uniref:hypothetical protein n=1 Tax=Acinetobacter vivianii TaxID=1776742 RepID=UPI002DB6D602|nr:hypothetical protein [Acinetobacter vivianii]MEB6666840.1 hypothetical protein [Acinetobacter vivianii]
MKINLQDMSEYELEDYEQLLVSQWSNRIALEVQISRIRSQYSDLLEIYNNLKNPKSIQNLKLSTSIKSLKYKLEELEDDLDDLIQDSHITTNY